MKIDVSNFHTSFYTVIHDIQNKCMETTGNSTKSGLTLHDFCRTTDQIGCDMSRRVIAGNRGK